jgi:hypothetical protein
MICRCLSTQRQTENKRMNERVSIRERVHKKKESQTQNGELIAHTLFCRQYTFCRFLIFCILHLESKTQVNVLFKVRSPQISFNSNFQKLGRKYIAGFHFILADINMKDILIN